MRILALGLTIGLAACAAPVIQQPMPVSTVVMDRPVVSKGDVAEARYQAWVAAKEVERSSRMLNSNLQIQMMQTHQQRPWHHLGSPMLGYGGGYGRGYLPHLPWALQ